jgi:hypothetical protein
MIRDLIIGGAAIPIALASFDLQPDRRVKGGSLKPVHIAGIEDDVLAELQSGLAPDDAQYVTLATDATLTDERVLTGTPNQITIADGGAGGNVTLATPQDIHSAATPTFGGLTANGATMVDGSADVVQLTVQMDAGQTANALEIQQSDTTVITNISSAGGLQFSSARTLETTAGTLTLQSANLLMLQSATSYIVFRGAGNNTIMSFFARSTVGSEEITWSFKDTFGRCLVFTDFTNNLTRHDHGVQANPTVFIHDVSSANVSNNKWGSLHHDGTGFVITTGANVGVGTVPATIDNYLSIQPRGAETVRFVGTGEVGIGIAAPAAQLHVDQSSTSAAIPVLYLDQADVSEEMIEFNTTIGVGNAIEAVGAKTLTTTHFIKVTLPGSLTRYIPAGTIA